jgi:hypothetical protein
MHKCEKFAVKRAQGTVHAAGQVWYALFIANDGCSHDRRVQCRRNSCRLCPFSTCPPHLEHCPGNAVAIHISTFMCLHAAAQGSGHCTLPLSQSKICGASSQIYCVAAPLCEPHERLAAQSGCDRFQSLALGRAPPLAALALLLTHPHMLCRPACAAVWNRNSQGESAVCQGSCAKIASHCHWHQAAPAAW